MKIDPKQLDELSRRLGKLIPQGIKDVQADVEKNIRAVLQSAFSKMNLVTREEFDVQSAVLERTRAKLEALEKQVAALEQAAQPAAELPATRASKPAGKATKPSAAKDADQHE